MDSNRQNSYGEAFFFNNDSYKISMNNVVAKFLSVIFLMVFLLVTIDNITIEILLLNLIMKFLLVNINRFDEFCDKIFLSTYYDIEFEICKIYC